MTSTDSTHAGFGWYGHRQTEDAKRPMDQLLQNQRNGRRSYSASPSVCVMASGVVYFVEAWVHWRDRKQTGLDWNHTLSFDSRRSPCARERSRDGGVGELTVWKHADTVK